MVWDAIRGTKNTVKPYFNHLTAKQIFENDQNYIENFLSKKNIIETLNGMVQKAPRRTITDVFFKDLKTWIDFIDDSLMLTVLHGVFIELH